MTEQKDPKLVPSRELDAEVAKALGLTVIDYKGEGLMILRPIPGIEIKQAEPLPAYSSDMGACWAEVVPAIFEAGFDWQISSGFKAVEIVLKSDKSGKIVLRSRTPSICNVPAVLCRALLKVKKGEGA